MRPSTYRRQIGGFTGYFSSENKKFFSWPLQYTRRHFAVLHSQTKKSFSLSTSLHSRATAQRPIHTGLDNSGWVLFIQSIDAFRVKQIRNPPESDVLRICADTSGPGGPRALYNFLQSDAMLKVGRITHGLLICFDTARCNPIEKHANPRTNISDAKKYKSPLGNLYFFQQAIPDYSSAL